MDVIELVRTIIVGAGFPVIISAVIGLFKLLHEYKDLIRRVDELEKTMATKIACTEYNVLKSCFDDSIESIKNSIDKTSTVLEILTKNSMKHDVVLDTIQDKINELKDEIKTRPCITHTKGGCK